jgi:branched-chain amino acid transport system substrate-binding protein
MNIRSKRMKRILLALAVVVACGFLLTSIPVAHAQEITIGIDLSTTGPGASLGIPQKNALAFAPSTIAGHKVRYVVYDDASDPTMAVQNFKRLIGEDHVDMVVGTTLTPPALAVMDLLAESHTPMISLGQASSIVLPMDAKRYWVFKTPANDGIYAEAVVKHMVKHGVKTVSAIAFDDAYGESNFGEFKRLAEQAGLRILDLEKYKRVDTSVSGQILRILNGHPDAVYVVASGSPAALPELTLVERGYKGKVYQTSGAAVADFVRVGGKGVEGAILPTSPFLVAEQLPANYPTRAESLRFSKEYEAKFGPRSFFAALLWDAFNITNQAVPRALKTAKPGTREFRDAIRANIENTHGLRGATAVYNYSSADHCGVNQLGAIVVRIENGAWKLEEYTATN